jgi:hypothetical protein
LRASVLANSIEQRKIRWWQAAGRPRLRPVSKQVPSPAGTKLGGGF